MKKIQKNLLPIFILICLILGCKQFDNLVKENPDNNNNDTRPKTSERDPFEIPEDKENEEVSKLTLDKDIDGFPIPSESEISSDKKNTDNPFNLKRRIKFTNPANIKAVANFLKDELAKDNWIGNDRNRVGRIMANLDFEKENEELQVSIRKESEGTSVVASFKEKFPMHPKSSGGNRMNINGKITLTTNVPEAKNEVADFYNKTLSSQGWESLKPINSEGTTILNFSRNNLKVMIMLSESGGSTSIEIRM